MSSDRQVTYAQPGDVIQLVCTSSRPPASFDDDVTMTWYHNNALIDPSAVRLSPSYRRLRVRNARLTSRLTINDVTQLDSGHYRCVRRPGDDSDHIELRVISTSDNRLSQGLAFFTVHTASHFTSSSYFRFRENYYIEP